MTTQIKECNDVFDNYKKNLIALNNEIVKVKDLQEKLKDLKEGTLAYLELMNEITSMNTSIQQLQLNYQIAGLELDRFKTIVLIEFNAKSYSTL